MSETTNETKAALASGIITECDGMYCDMCDKGIVELYAGLPFSDLPEIYRVPSEYGLTVCANCLPAYLLERDLEGTPHSTDQE